ncbi:MAG: peptide chain release factor 1, partial [Chloroflexi bacterium]|nr:peptide chain release factor 1 [Chloroflexota bacterium]
MSLDARLAGMEAEARDIEDRLGRPEVVADLDQLRTLGRELARLQPVVTAARELREVRG